MGEVFKTCLLSTSKCSREEREAKVSDRLGGPLDPLQYALSEMGVLRDCLNAEHVRVKELEALAVDANSIVAHFQALNRAMRARVKELEAALRRIYCISRDDGTCVFCDRPANADEAALFDGAEHHPNCPRRIARDALERKK